MFPTKNELIIATYNLEFCGHKQTLIKNIKQMAKKKVTVFCLQEVIDTRDHQSFITPLLKQLGPAWKATSHVGETNTQVDMGTAIVWNSAIIEYQNEAKILLPKIKKLQLHEVIFSSFVGGLLKPLQRRALTCTFLFQNKSIRISSIHLDHVGGTRHRMKQLQYFLSQLKTVEYEIICGDFNSFDLLQTGKERAMLKRYLGSVFVDASAQSGPTADIYNISMENGWPLFKWLIKTFTIHVRRKLDYIWVKKLEVIECDKLNVGGSDHLPLVAKLKME